MPETGMHWVDWGIVGLYLLGAVGIGIYFTRKAASSTTDFFVAGRSLPWFIAGTSIVATTFSSDTPLFVSGMSREEGIWSNWFWWSAAMGQIAGVFFFAKLWRRTEALTDIEFLVKRYDATPQRNVLRIFKVFFDGIVVNCVIMASVTVAIVKLVKVLLHLSDDALFTVPFFGDFTSSVAVLLILSATALLYSALSGLYGVVYTDIIQFSLAMIGSIALAVICYMDASRGDGLMASLGAAKNFDPELLNFAPPLKTFDLKTFTFMIYLGVIWWGASPGGGYMVQRLLACRSERDSVLAFLWYNFCHYVLRPWPWIIVGMLSLIYFPDLADKESAFPEMIDKFMPMGLKGVMVAAMLAAFMSTLDTHLNWGTSYLINDFYQPFINPQAPQKTLVRASRICMLLLTVVALLVSSQIDYILDAYKWLGVIGGGVGLVMIARWYWWRVTPWCEITAIAVALVVGNFLVIYLPSDEQHDYFTVRFVLSLAITTVAWVTVALLSSNKPTAGAIAFYKKMRIGGPGWGKVARLTGVKQLSGELTRALLAWVCCVGLLYSLLLGIGKLIFLQWAMGAGLLVAAAGFGYALREVMRGLRFGGVEDGAYDKADSTPKGEGA